MKSFHKIVVSFFLWRIALFFVAFLSIYLIHDFGARFPYYQELLIGTGLPYWVWGFANFDGVHYITIASSGYSAQYTQAFFPLYPLLVSVVTLGKNYLLTGLVLSNVFFVISLFVLYKLFRLDYKEKDSFNALLLLLSFPTAYYFGSIYTESFFLFLCVLSILFIRKENYLVGGVLAALASATRLLGVVLLIVMAIEFLQTKKRFSIKKDILSALGFLIAPLGVIFYMVYLKLNFGNPLYFLSAQPFFGAQRSDHPFILLPQVLFRYVKILISVSPTSLPFFNALSEFLFTVIPLTIIIFAFRKVRLSYVIFSLIALLMPTFTGTLSSMPRYALMMFLVFPFMVKISGKFFYPVLILLGILQAILLTLFIRGYWVA